MNTIGSARIVSIATAILLTFGTSSAEAGPCSGFVDVDASSPFCAGVSWMKNRGITLGCSSDLYCPGGMVTREQMAAFMSRLDRVLPPTVVDSAGKALGSYDGALLLRTGGEIHPIPLEIASLGKLRVYRTHNVFYELPGCSGKTFIWSMPTAYRTVAAVVASTDGMLGLYASAPYASASPVMTWSFRGTDGICTPEIVTAEMLEVRFVGALGYHSDDLFELR